MSQVLRLSETFLDSVAYFTVDGGSSQNLRSPLSSICSATDRLDY